MLTASNEYITSMAQPIRNRGYIKITIGLVSQEAQSNATVIDDTDYPVLFYSNETSAFNGVTIGGEYATAEPTFSMVDGSRYFAPESSTTYYRNNGALSEEVLGGLYIQLTTAAEGYNLSGLTIDFGPVYPTSFTIVTNNESYSVTNNSRYYESDLSFVDATYMIITPLSMLGGSSNRLRIYKMQFGKSLTFGNSDVKSFSSKEYVSPICDSVPSYDMTLVVNNTDNKFDVDDDYNVMSFMAIGQEVIIQHGYDVNDDGTIEWLDPYVSALATWDANDSEATFTATDKFAIATDKFVMSGDTMYDGGHTMWDCAESICNQSFGGTIDFTSSTLDYYMLANPLPYNTYPELLQMLSNATKSILRMKANGVLGIMDYSEQADYTIAQDQIKTNIIAKKTSKIRSVNVSYTLFSKNSSASLEDAQTEDVYVSTSQSYTGVFTFDDCYSEWSVSTDDSGLVASIVDSNPRYVSVVIIRNSGDDGLAKLTIQGKKYTKSSSAVAVSVSESGEDINWDNPLISDSSIASDVANHLAEYYGSTIEYEIDWRGDPRVEAGDIVTLERKNKTDVQVRIYQNELTFNGAWSGHILARRLS